MTVTNIHTVIEEVRESGVSNSLIIFYLWMAGRFPKGATIKQIAEAQGITIRSAYRIIARLSDKDMVSTQRNRHLNMNIYTPEY